MFSGIVECMGKITTIDKTKEYYQVEVSYPSGFNEHLKKGASIAVDGAVSYTHLTLPTKA